MEYTNLGATGIKVSPICLGTMSFGSTAWRSWVLEEAEARPFFERAVELGINFFDTADRYSGGESEAILGRALRDLGLSRDKVVVATKLFGPMGDDPNQRGLSRKHIKHAIDGSLSRLGMDYVDLYQIHRFDPEVPIEETLEALSDLVHAGKVLHIGASNLAAWQLSRYLSASDRHGFSRFVTVQNQYNLVHRDHERELFPLCREEGIGVVPWSPLARGFLAGNRYPGGKGETLRGTTDEYAHRMYYRDSDFAVVERIADVARNRGRSNTQIALAWLRRHPLGERPRRWRYSPRAHRRSSGRHRYRVVRRRDPDPRGTLCAPPRGQLPRSLNSDRHGPGDDVPVGPSSLDRRPDEVTALGS